jgi:hypothetical protein
MKTIAIVVVAAAFSSSAGAQDTLAAAKDQYAAAAYEDALTSLSHVDASGANADAVTRQVEQYRAFCLYALGRTGEAEQVAESLLTKAPLLEIADDASPRIEAMFTSVRKRVLPTLVRAEYRTAKSAVEQKDFASARPHLVGAERMLEEARKIGVWDETMADLGLLIDGFLDLTRTADAVPSAAPAASSPAVEAPRPSIAAATAAPAAPAPRPAAPVQPRPAAPKIYSAEDPDVVPAEAISTAVTGFPRELVQKTLPGGAGVGLIYLVIDEQGHVEQASIRESINTPLDKLLIVSARSWRFRPATRNGVAVKYAKIVRVNVR